LSWTASALGKYVLTFVFKAEGEEFFRWDITYVIVTNPDLNMNLEGLPHFKDQWTDYYVTYHTWIFTGDLALTFLITSYDTSGKAEMCYNYDNLNYSAFSGKDYWGTYDVDFHVTWKYNDKAKITGISQESSSLTNSFWWTIRNKDRFAIGVDIGSAAWSPIYFYHKIQVTKVGFDGVINSDPSASDTNGYILSTYRG
jgi:hypothetical protein